jgi:DNA-binding NarL/FixJ family response regulator
VILDFQLSDQIAIAATRAIVQADSEARVIFLTSDERDNVILAAIDAGASAVLYMSMATAEVIQTVRTVAGGASLISPRTIATLLNGRRKTDGVRDRLTGREREVLGLMAEGTSNRDMAARLGISYVTVRCHVRNLAGKLAAHSQLEVLVRAEQLDLVERRAATRVAFS